MVNKRLKKIEINSKNAYIKVNIVNLLNARFKNIGEEIPFIINRVEDSEILEEIFINTLKVENLDEFNIILKKVNKLD